MNELLFFTSSKRREDILDAIQHKEILDVSCIFIRENGSLMFDRPKSCKGCSRVISFYNAMLFNLVNDFVELGLCKKATLGDSKPFDKSTIECFFSDNSAEIILETIKGSKLALTAEDLKYGVFRAITFRYNIDCINDFFPVTIDKYFCADGILGAFFYNKFRTNSSDWTFAREIDWGQIDKAILYLFDVWES